MIDKKRASLALTRVTGPQSHLTHSAIVFSHLNTELALEASLLLLPRLVDLLVDSPQKSLDIFESQTCVSPLASTSSLSYHISSELD